ncbi:hypothetical protein P879_03113 [Paragonimus westermani]|uniref:mannosyl-oligosaccharide 1,3-1,6-alpha-mannosidase n=1 Tax=Paragonimus westermani TaxID=34504 RepID=A0A8T0DGF3_9TREM|nr:hypothetical protein P879_03113 [Paragonimus westermani]
MYIATTLVGQGEELVDRLYGKVRSKVIRTNKDERDVEPGHGVVDSPNYPRTNTPNALKGHLKLSAIYEALEFKNSPGGVWKQGFPIQCSYDALKQEPIEVFIVPHSHQDPGWVRTFEEYFVEKTKPCLDSTLKILQKRPEARFTYAEMSFFSMWVGGLTQDEKHQVKRLLDSGQLEVTSGGWVMTDEATAHHYGMLDQLIEGHHWLLDTFGYHPNTSWSIDPFGHSPTVAYLARQMQFSGMVIQRVHYEVKKYLAERKSLEFRWRQLWDDQGSTEIISHMMPFYSYDIPHTCGPDPSICCQFDFARLDRFRCPWGKPPLPINERNIAERATALRDQYCQKAMLFDNSGVLLVPLGDDFRYLSEHEWELQLDNYDQLIAYWNSHPQLGIRARFATLSDYFTTLHKRLGSHPGMTPVTENLPTLSGDLFTYADRNQDYWSGLFTSRPNLKSLVRVLESELQAAELLYSYAQYLIGSQQSLLTVRPIIENLYRNLTGARRNLGLFQHHDGVTGTAKPHVVDDYRKRLISAIKEARLVSTMSAAYLLLLSSSRKFSNPRLPVGPDMRDLLQNVVAQSDKPDDQGSKVLSLENRFLTNSLPQPELFDFTNPELARIVYLFNPLPNKRTVSVNIHVHGKLDSLRATQIRNAETTTETEEHSLPLQTEPLLIDLMEQTTDDRISHVRIGSVVMEPMSLTRVQLKTEAVGSKSDGRIPTKVTWPSSSADDIVLRSDIIELRFDGRAGFLKHFHDLRTGLHVDIFVEFVQYQTTRDSYGSESGAYLFIPSGPGQLMKLSDDPKIRLIRGPVTEELTVFTPLVNHTVRLYKDKLHVTAQAVEIENTVDLSDLSNLELVMRIRTNITGTVGNPARTFYTDSNCFQFIRRTYHEKLPLQGNLYPMTCATFLDGGHKTNSDSDAAAAPSLPSSLLRLTLLSAQSLGITSQAEGELSVWLDRRAPKDDDRGLGAPLLGRWTAVSKFRVLLEEVIPAQTHGDLSDAVPQLTLMAHFVLLDLLRPIQRFSVDPDLASLMPPWLTLMPQFVLPCDYEVVNLKTFHSPATLLKSASSPSGSQLGLLLRRLSTFTPTVSQATPQQTSFCNAVETDEIDIQSMFSSLKLHYAANTRRVTMVPEPDEQLDWQSAIRLRSTGLAAYLLR